MKYILGLDLGPSSIGWALITEDGVKVTIVALGSRIIPYKDKEEDCFVKGGETRNAVRTKARTARKGYDRYQLRRQFLVSMLVKNDMMPDENLMKLSKMDLWQLRARAVTDNISRAELGRILLWLNQKRGYKSSRSDANLSKKDTEYVKTVKGRYEEIKEKNLTIGQHFYNLLCSDEYFRVKENVFPREAYVAEFDAICTRQKGHLGLTNELIAKIRNEIIYYQRPLKSQKGLVAVCEFEGFYVQKNGKEYFVGPKVAPKSSPLFQVSKLWESINNIRLSTRRGDTICLTLDEKRAVFDYLDTHDSMTSAALFRILKKSKTEYTVSKQLEKGLQGNVTKNAIVKILDNDKRYANLLRFNLNIVETQEDCYLYSTDTGEIKGEKKRKYVDSSVEHEPLYRLWHTIYSINDIDECTAALQKQFDIDADTATKLATIDFGKYGFGNKSVKVIRKTLPYMMEGDMYSEAMSYGGYNHSFSMTKAESDSRKLLDRLKPIEKNSLRQPVVEKILNQMVNLVNAIIDKYGRPDEIRVELARELKQSKEERRETDWTMTKRQRENSKIVERLAEYGLRGTRTNIQKYRLFEEMNDHESRQNAICVYCGQPISLTDAISGDNVDVEHIIPKSKLFDDSMNNKTLAHRCCNADKNDMTAYDFMKTKSPQEFNSYIERVNKLYADKIINKAKRDKLLMTESKIPNDFINRQLRESQYIARKSREILQTVCRNVWATSGTITAELRRLWGWEDVTMNLQMPRYRECGLTETVEWTSDHGRNTHTKEVIKDWTKRDDHRHHAVDALTIACTRQGYIQRFNTLNSSKTREDMFNEVAKCSENYKEKLSLLDKYIISQRPIDVCDVEKAVAGILISFKAGKKVAVYGTRKTGRIGNKKVVQTGIIVPRGALSEEYVYGKIKTMEPRRPVKYLFENPSLIVKGYIRKLIEDRLALYDGDLKKTIASLKKSPIYLDSAQTKILEYATCFKEEVVIKYTVDVGFKKVDKVVDKPLREILKRRLERFGNDPKKAFKDVDKDGTVLKWYEDEGLPRPIRSVRCATGLSAIVPVKRDENNKEVGFVKPGNNHHVAIYRDKDGNMIEHVCTFWHAVERKKYGFPVVIKNTKEVWDRVLSAPDGTYTQAFIDQLPLSDGTLLLSMQQNEMFVLECERAEVERAMATGDNSVVSKYLYRVQKIAPRNYYFRHHLETQLVDSKDSKASKRFYCVQSLNALFSLNPIKVKIDYLGNITSVQ